MEQKTIELNGRIIRLSWDAADCQYKPELVDIAFLVGLEFLANRDETVKLHGFLLDHKFKKALKFVAYNADMTIPEARLRIFRFLTIGLGCMLCFNDNPEQKQTGMNVIREFLSGICEYPYSENQVIEIMRTDFDNAFTLE